MTEIPYGYCQCGCGQKTNLSAKSHPKRGYEIGKPNRFLPGHGTRIREFPTKPLSERFWSKVAIDADPDKCWEWQGKPDAYGYGKIRRVSRGKMEVAHRVAYELTHGIIPDGLWVLHKCDNPPCVNPNHLFLGTPMDNVLDKMQKGRQPKGDQIVTRRGEDHHSHKLTAEKVRLIRNLYDSGEANQEQIAKQMNVARQTVGNVLRGITWKSVK
jgi:HNH endonuclease/MarR family